MPTDDPAPVPEPTARPDPVVAADWYPDPVCRNGWRYWDGYEWTAWVGNDGERSEDPLGESEDPDPPAEGDKTSDCANRLRPLTAAELGCDSPDPACRIGGDGWPVATRLVSLEELRATGGYNHQFVEDDYWPDVPEHVALGYLTRCLQEWGRYVPSPYDRWTFGGTPVQTCSAMWKNMAYPVTYLGAGQEPDLQCVYERFERLWLRGHRVAFEHAHTGWAEYCGSWLDPQPVREVPDDCSLPLPDYYERASSTDGWAEWSVYTTVAFPDEEAFRQWWCNLWLRCDDLYHQIAPKRADLSPDDPCRRVLTGIQTLVARKGRCAELAQLNVLVNLEGPAEFKQYGTTGLPAVPPIPGDILVAC